VSVVGEDFYDARDEHDIAELRRAMRGGTPPKLVGGRKAGRSSGCAVIVFVAVAAPVAGVWAAAKGWG
jgi:hypothetical protein